MAESFADIDEIMQLVMARETKRADADMRDAMTSVSDANKQHVDLAGIADDIRSRVASGDAGTSVAGTTAPGWGGTTAGVVTIVAPLVLIIAAGGVGAALGVTGVFGTTQAAPAGEIPAYVLTVDTAGGSICPGGPQIDRLSAGTRVFAVARSDDSAFLGVRNPADAGSLLWFAASDVVLDAGSPDPASLPVAGCPDVTVTYPTPVPTVTQQPTPPPDDGTNPPPPPKDTTPPVVTSLKANKTFVINNEAVTLSFASSDNVGVTKVVISWSNSAVTGSVSLGASGNYNWSSNSAAGNSYGNYTFTAVAYDAAGNHSAPVQVIVNRQYLG